jgi:hypothetical protein
MKKVITSDQKTVTLKEVLREEHPIIGFQYKDTKATLIPLKYKSNQYIARCFDAWELGNGYDFFGVDSKTIAEWETFFTIQHNAEMFVFDSPKELFTWFVK